MISLAVRNLNSKAIIESIDMHSYILGNEMVSFYSLSLTIFS